MEDGIREEKAWSKERRERKIYLRAAFDTSCDFQISKELEEIWFCGSTLMGMVNGCKLAPVHVRARQHRLRKKIQLSAENEKIKMDAAF